MQIGLPLVIRPAYTLGGTGGGIAHTEERARARSSQRGLAAQPDPPGAGRALAARLERDRVRGDARRRRHLHHRSATWRTSTRWASTPATPSWSRRRRRCPTTSTRCCARAALQIIRALGIEGGCNVQFALDPRAPTYYVIEVNPRVSRSSALASKATGYPIARVAAKIAVGKRLDEIPNAVTEQTTRRLRARARLLRRQDPALAVRQVPDRRPRLGTQMKATGEVMAIDRSFEAALQKAVRSLESRRPHAALGGPPGATGRRAPDRREPNDLRLWALMAALRGAATPAELADASGIDRWFLHKLATSSDASGGCSAAADADAAAACQAARLLRSQIGTLATAARAGARRAGSGTAAGLQDGRHLRRRVRGGHAVLLRTYEAGERGAARRRGPKALVHRLRADPHRPGHRVRLLLGARGRGAARAGVRSDHGQLATRRRSAPTSTPRRGSTSSRSTRSACATSSRTSGDRRPPGGRRPVRRPDGDQPGRAAGARRGRRCSARGVEAIDLAEDRRRFERCSTRSGSRSRRAAAATTVDEALRDRRSVIGYPVLVRPSYVLGGRAMEIVHNADELRRYVRGGQASSRQCSARRC